MNPDTNCYELTLKEVETVKWALLYARARNTLLPSEREHIVELENKFVWKE